MHSLQRLSFQLFSNDDTTNVLNGSVLNKNKKFGLLTPATTPLLAFDTAGLPNKLPAKYNLIRNHEKILKDHDISCQNYCVIHDGKGCFYNALVSFCGDIAVITLYASKKYCTYYCAVNDKGTHHTATIYNNARGTYEQALAIIESKKSSKLSTIQHCEHICSYIGTYMIKNRLSQDASAFVYKDLIDNLTYHYKTEFASYGEPESSTCDTAYDGIDLDELLKDL